MREERFDGVPVVEDVSEVQQDEVGGLDIVDQFDTRVSADPGEQDVPEFADHECLGKR